MEDKTNSRNEIVGKKMATLVKEKQVAGKLVFENR